MITAVLIFTGLVLVASVPLFFMEPIERDLGDDDPVEMAKWDRFQSANAWAEWK